MFVGEATGVLLAIAIPENFRPPGGGRGGLLSGDRAENTSTEGRGRGVNTTERVPLPLVVHFENP